MDICRRRRRAFVFDTDQDDKVCTATILKVRQARDHLRALKAAARQSDLPVERAPSRPARSDQEILDFARQSLSSFVLSPCALGRTPPRLAADASSMPPAAPKKSHPGIARVRSTEAAGCASKCHATVARRLSFCVDEVAMMVK